MCAKYWSLGIVLIAYIVGVLAMLIGSNNEKKREIAKDQIIGYLTANSCNIMTLDAIREKINQGYSSQFLNSLPTHYPNEIRRAKLKGSKQGLARFFEEGDGTSA